MMIGVHYANILSVQKGYEMKSEYRGIAPYSLVFNKDGKEVGSIPVEKFDSSGVECVPMKPLFKLLGIE